MKTTSQYMFDAGQHQWVIMPKDAKMIYSAVLQANGGPGGPQLKLFCSFEHPRKSTEVPVAMAFYQNDMDIPNNAVHHATFIAGNAPDGAPLLIHMYRDLDAKMPDGMMDQLIEAKKQAALRSLGLVPPTGTPQ